MSSMVAVGARRGSDQPFTHESEAGDATTRRLRYQLPPDARNVNAVDPHRPLELLRDTVLVHFLADLVLCIALDAVRPARSPPGSLANKMQPI